MESFRYTRKHFIFRNKILTFLISEIDGAYELNIHFSNL
ncbi:hypothetical protein PPHE_a3590 [Pseudoalteromonas phenolica O-BC30]|nr:hypothetical protein [Pseudoalteromonas phenolica O-BC30]